MDLKSGYPFWAVKSGLIRAFPRLEADLACDVAVIGGGISGALIADELARHGHSVAVIEQRDIGWGSSAASTALIQYEIDEHMVDLAKRHGEDNAVLAYQACLQAVHDLHELLSPLRDAGFRKQQSLYYASRKRDEKALRVEFAMRSKHGFPVRWIDHAEMGTRYGMDAPAAILSSVAATLDPYRATHRLLARVVASGGGVFDRSHVTRIETGPRSVRLETADDVIVRCRHAVVAGGYASQGWLDRRVAQNRSSYAFVTDPLGEGEMGFLSDTMIWETARPYLYLRSTTDGRLMVGGEDDAIDIPARRDSRVESKARKLANRVSEIYPGLDMRPTFSWAGTFAETKDGLPFFGPHPQWGPRVHFAMAYGGNGITYSMIGAGLLRAGIERRRHPLAQLFSFARHA